MEIYLILNKSLMQILVRMIIPPAADPCIERPTIKLPMLVEEAQIAEPAKNVASAARKTIFRPQISDNFPQTRVAAAPAKRYADPIQVYAVAEWSSLTIVGVAVVAIVKSRAARKRESC